MVLAFGVPCPKTLVSLPKNKDVKILSHNVIYRLLDMLKVYIKGGIYLFDSSAHND